MQKITDPTIPAAKIEVTVPETTSELLVYTNYIKNVVRKHNPETNEITTEQIDNLKNKGLQGKFDISTLGIGEVLWANIGTGDANNLFSYFRVNRKQNDENTIVIELYSQNVPINQTEDAFNLYDLVITEVWAE